MLDRLSTRIFAGFAVAGLLVASFLFGYGVGHDSGRETSEPFELLTEARQAIRELSLRSVDEQRLSQGSVRGLIEALEDPYAEYLDPSTYESFKEEHTIGHFSGVGMWLRPEEGRLKVVSVLPDSPADRAGVTTGDFVTAVGGKPIEGLSLKQVVHRIRGEPGTEIKVTVHRGDEIREFALVRENIERSSVEHLVLRGGIGHIQVLTFISGTGSKVREAVRSLIEKKVRGVILDLRGNPGGLTEEAVEVASAFLEDGKVVSFKERGKAELTFNARGPLESSLPLVVLVDEGSASASEIVAGALQDRGRAIVVGTETYGKGFVQTIVPLSDGSALRITTASYYLPSGRSIGERGVIPDVAVSDKTVQLARAREILGEMLAGMPAPASA